MLKLTSIIISQESVRAFLEHIRSLFIHDALFGSVIVLREQLIHPLCRVCCSPELVPEKERVHDFYRHRFKGVPDLISGILEPRIQFIESTLDFGQRCGRLAQLCHVVGLSFCDHLQSALHECFGFVFAGRISSDGRMTNPQIHDFVPGRDDVVRQDLSFVRYTVDRHGDGVCLRAGPDDRSRCRSKGTTEWIGAGAGLFWL